MHGGSEPTTIAGQLAAFTHGFTIKAVPPEVVKDAQLVLLDALGCALGALGCDPARILEESIQDFGGGNSEATLFGSGLRTNVLNAVVVNGTLVRYLDASDAYIVLAPRGGSAGAHPSDAVAMVLALAERQGISGLGALEAIVLAYQLYGGLSHYEMVPLAWKGWTMEAKGPLVTPLIAGRLLGLREDQLHLVAGPDAQLSSGLWAHADPVKAGRRFDRSIGLDRDREAAPMQRGEQGVVDLQERLAAGDDLIAVIRNVAPFRLDRRGERLRARIGAAAGAVGAHKIGIAEAADGSGPVLLAARPQVAAGKTAEHGRAPGLAALALQRVEHLFYGVAHGGPLVG